MSKTPEETLSGPAEVIKRGLTDAKTGLGQIEVERGNVVGTALAALQLARDMIPTDDADLRARIDTIVSMNDSRQRAAEPIKDEVVETVRGLIDEVLGKLQG